jgi:hypothetical protein
MGNSSDVTREIFVSILAGPQAIRRDTPQQLAVRTILERLILLRKGAQTKTKLRGRSSEVGGL